MILKRTWCKLIFALIKKILIGLLSSIINASNHTKWVFLSNQKWVIQPTLINLHPNQYSQEFQYYQFSVKLDRCIESCNTLNYLSYKVCIANKTGELNLSIFKIITGINESKVLTKDISCEFICKFDGKNVNQVNSGITIYADVSVKKYICEKSYVWNPSTCICENRKYLESIMDDSKINCDKVIKLYNEKI